MIYGLTLLQFLVMDPRKLCNCADNTVGQKILAIT